MSHDDQYKFVILEYRNDLTARPLLLIACGITGGGMAAAEVAIDPTWTTWVSLDDHEYIQAMLEEFREDAVDDPEGLMEGVGDLFAGLLATARSGTCSTSSLEAMSRALTGGTLTNRPSH